MSRCRLAISSAVDWRADLSWATSGFGFVEAFADLRLSFFLVRWDFLLVVRLVDFDVLAFDFLLAFLVTFLAFFFF